MNYTVKTKIIEDMVSELDTLAKFYKDESSIFDKFKETNNTHYNAILNGIKKCYTTISDNISAVSKYLNEYQKDVVAVEQKMSGLHGRYISVPSASSLVNKYSNSLLKCPFDSDKIFTDVSTAVFEDSKITQDINVDLSHFQLDENVIKALLLTSDSKKLFSKEEAAFLSAYYGNYYNISLAEQNTNLSLAQEELDKLTVIEKHLQKFGYVSYKDMDTVLKYTTDASVKEQLQNALKSTGCTSFVDFGTLLSDVKGKVDTLNATKYALQQESKNISFQFDMKSEEFLKFKSSSSIDPKNLKEIATFDSMSNSTTISYKEYCKKYGDVDPFTFQKAVNETLTNPSILGIKEEKLLNDLAKVNDVNPDIANYYAYLYQRDGVKSANNFLQSMEDTINRCAGEKEAQEFLKSLANLNDEETRLKAVSNHLKISMEGIDSGIGGFADNINYALEGLFSSKENRVYSTSEYETMFLLQALSSSTSKIENGLVSKSANGKLISSSDVIDYTADYGKLLDHNFQISSSIGNMIPSILVSIASPPVGQAAFGISAGGGSFHSAMVEGYDKGKSLLYGVTSGASELLTEKVLGGIPFLSDTKVTSFKTLLHSCVKEGNEEFVQSYIDAIAGKAILKKSVDLKEVTGEAVQSAVYGAITGGVMNFPSFAINSINIKNIQNQVNAGSVSQSEIVEAMHQLIPETSGMNYNQIIEEFSSTSKNITFELVESKGKTISKSGISSMLSGLGIFGFGSNLLGEKSGNDSSHFVSSSNSQVITETGNSSNPYGKGDGSSSFQSFVVDRNTNVNFESSSLLNEIKTKLSSLASEAKNSSNPIDVSFSQTLNQLSNRIQDVFRFNESVSSYVNKSIVTTLPKAVLGTMYSIPSLLSKLKIDPVIQSNRMSEKILNDDVYHITSLESAQKILDSNYIKASDSFTSMGTKKAYFFGGIPQFNDVVTNLLSVSDTQVAVKLKVDENSINQFYYRSFNDDAVVTKGDYHFNSEQAQLVYLGLKMDETGKLVYQEISKSEFDERNKNSNNNFFTRTTDTLKAVPLSLGIEFNLLAQNLEKAFQNMDLKNTAANISQKFSSLLMDSNFVQSFYKISSFMGKRIDENVYLDQMAQNKVLTKVEKQGRKLNDVASPRISVENSSKNSNNKMYNKELSRNFKDEMNLNIKDLPANTQEYVKKLANESDYLSLKAFIDSLAHAYKYGDEDTKTIVANIDALNLVKNSFSLEDDFHFGTSKFMNESTLPEDSFFYRKHMYITNEVGNGFQVMSHEMGHLLWSVIDGKSLPSDFSQIMSTIQERLNSNSTKLESFLTEAREYKEKLWTQTTTEAEEYMIKTQGSFQEHIDQLLQNETELRKELDLAASVYEIEASEVERFIKEKDREKIHDLLFRYTRYNYVNDNFYYICDNDSSMQIYDTVAGIIDSIYNGSNPYYETIYDNGFLRSHTSKYFSNQVTNSFDEQFADFTRMKFYDMQAVQLIVRELCGNEWFDMMNQKYHEIATKMQNHEVADSNGLSQVSNLDVDPDTLSKRLKSSYETKDLLNSLNTKRQKLLADNIGLSEIIQKANEGVTFELPKHLADAYLEYRSIDSQIRNLNEVDLNTTIMNSNTKSNFKDNSHSFHDFLSNVKGKLSNSFKSLLSGLNVTDTLTATKAEILSEIESIENIFSDENIKKTLAKFTDSVSSLLQPNMVQKEVSNTVDNASIDSIMEEFNQILNRNPKIGEMLENDRKGYTNIGEFSDQLMRDYLRACELEKKILTFQEVEQQNDVKTLSDLNAQKEKLLANNVELSEIIQKANEGVTFELPKHLADAYLEYRSIDSQIRNLKEVNTNISNILSKKMIDVVFNGKTYNYDISQIQTYLESLSMDQIVELYNSLTYKENNLFVKAVANLDTELRQKNIALDVDISEKLHYFTLVEDAFGKVQANEVKFKNFKNEIYETVNPEWSTIEKIRKLYIELNSRMHYDVNYLVNDQDFKNNLYNEKVDINSLKSQNVICKGWSEAFKQLLVEAGFDENRIKIVGKENTGAHKWVEIDLGDRIIIADATEVINHSVDLANCKVGSKTNGLLLAPKEFSGTRLSKAVKSNSNLVTTLNEQWSDIDSKIGYKYSLELQNKANSLFSNSSYYNNIMQSKDSQFFYNEMLDIDIPSNVDGYEAYIYFQKILHSQYDFLSKDVKVTLQFNEYAPNLHEGIVFVQPKADSDLSKFMIFSESLGKMTFDNRTDYESFLVNLKVKGMNR